MPDQPAIRAIATASVPDPPAGLFSNCIVAGDTIHISGQHAGTPQGAVGGNSVLAQTREALTRVMALIHAAGGTEKDVVKLIVYLCDMSGKVEVSAARREIFSEPLPCSTLVGVHELVNPDLLVEIDAIALLGAGGRKAALHQV